MHHVPRIFSSRRQRQSKSMDRGDQTPSPSPRRKLIRRNAAKNFDFTPESSSSLPSSLPSSSSTSANTSTSSAARTRSMELNHSSDSSLQVKGNDGQLERVLETYGLSPKDFELPQEAWDVFKSSSDFSQHRKHGMFDEDEIEKPQEQEVQGSASEVSCGYPCNEQADKKVEIAEVEQLVAPIKPLNNTAGRGIIGERPPSLTPPPAMSLRGIDNGCSTWDLLKGLAPEDAGETDLYPIRHSSSEGEAGKDICNQRGGFNTNNCIPRSESCTFTSSHEDDSSSTTTDNSPGCRMLEIPIAGWQKGKLLGRGSFGTVYEAFSCAGGYFFAVKEVSLLEQGSQGRQCILSLKQEIETLSQLDHDNIVRYLGTEMDDENLSIFLEYMAKGSLLNLYQTYDFKDPIVAAYTWQILSGLKYLHSKKYIHRDVKCANILVHSNGAVKLADFGLAKQVAQLTDLKSCKGTALWMAPEVVKNLGYGISADIWSLGCTVLEMATRKLPYNDLEPFQALYRIGNGQPPEVPDNLSPDLRDFILKCLQVNPSDRPSAVELLEHPFLKGAARGYIGVESPESARAFWR